MPSFYIPLSGLEANSNALSVTANNLANLNTIGYKAQRPLFQDLFFQQVGTSGDGNPQYIGVGTSIQGIDPQFREGSSRPSGVPTDEPVRGNAFCVLHGDGTQQITRSVELSNW